MTTPPIQWYPGHIAKARKALQQQLQRVDAIFEVLDARIPLASRHPDLETWTQNKPRIVILNRCDCISPERVRAWQRWFRQQNIETYPTNAQSGEGVRVVKNAALTCGVQVNQRRRDRGMKPRAVRAAVVGFPNVGKSALLNRLTGKRAVASARKPGVTRELRWVRLGQELDLLDSPGILPPKLDDQDAAVKLAICDDIGTAAYSDERVAAELLELLPQVEPTSAVASLRDRYQFESLDVPGSILVHQLANRRYADDTTRAAKHVLTDYRKGILGALGLENVPDTPV
ncbi:MAG: ribosome biogenesis GTPase YlqF [Cyanobacteria bacterium J06642_2]